MSELTHHIKSFLEKTGFSLSEEAWQAFAEIWSETEIKRKTTICSPGDVEQHLYFICEGVQRIYYFDEQDREATLVLTYPYSFAGVMDSFLLQAPSRYYFETLTQSVILKTTYTNFNAITLRFPEIDNIIRQLTYHALSGLLERMAELQSFSSEEKFRKLMQRSPHLLRLVPHKYLANYLGIDATNFSKLVNSVKL